MTERASSVAAALLSGDWRRAPDAGLAGEPIFEYPLYRGGMAVRALMSYCSDHNVAGPKFEEWVIWPSDNYLRSGGGGGLYGARTFYGPAERVLAEIEKEIAREL